MHGAWGEPVRVSQTFWGFIDSPYPGAPASITQSLSLSEYLQDALSDAVVSRVTWLGSADPEAAEDWLADHADFTSAVGLLEPDRAQRLWEGLIADSVQRSAFDREVPPWTDGPLAQLMAVAPLAVGNLNGIPARQRDLFNRKGLADLLADDTLDDGTATRLKAVRRALERQGGGTLLSLFLDSDGEPRASIAYGDVETSDMIVTVTHGISTDLEDLSSWVTTTDGVRRDVVDEAARRGEAVSVATVAYFGWDSGGKTTVFGLDHADAGAAQYSELVSVYATHADKDWTAPLGRNGLLGSTHTTNPGDVLDEEHRLGSNGGIVDFGPGADGAYRRIDGLPTDGHASHTGDPWYEWTGEEIGYFDERAQSYLGGIDGLADMLTEAR